MNRPTIRLIVGLVLGVASAVAGPVGANFGSIRIGDVDGAGFGDGTTSCGGGQCYRATSAAPCSLPVNLDGVGVLRNADFLADLNCSGAVLFLGAGDNFDRRSVDEKNGGAVRCTGCSDVASSGSQWTDLSLSKSYCLTFPCTDFPDGDDDPPNEPEFTFDFFVLTDDIDITAPLFFKIVFGDYDIVPATITLTPVSAPSVVVNLDVQPADGTLQAVSRELDPADVFTSFAGGYRGQLHVKLDLPTDPYLVVDYVEIGPRRSEDCNDNGANDSRDIAEGVSADWNGDGVPDECCERIRVSQETSAGAGDFVDNVLGCVDAYHTADSVAEYYGYDGASFTGPAPTLTNDRSHVFFVSGQDGLALVSVHDAPDQSGGSAEMQFDVLGDPDGAMFAITDGGPSTGDAYVSTLGTSFASQHTWSTFTDGVMLADLGGPWAVLAQFAPFTPSTTVIGGLSSWVVSSADGAVIPVVLQQGLRARFECCATCTTPPVEMVGWWPLDEIPGLGTTAEDLARTSDGAHVGPLQHNDDLVHGSLRFTDATTYVYVYDPLDGALDFGTAAAGGDFSIDAWIRPASTAPMLQGIVDKSSLEAPDWVWGYSFYLRGDRLALSLASNSPPAAAVPAVEFLSPPVPALGDGNWHLVAVTVDRDRTNGVRFWVDGARIDGDDLDPTVIPGSLATWNAGGGSAGTWPLLIGQVGHFFSGAHPFDGDIDEVEIVPYALKQGVIEEIARAGVDGKCQSGCALTSRARCCGPGSQLGVTLCNYGALTTAMSWSPGSCPDHDLSVVRLDPAAWPAPGDPAYGPYDVAPGDCVVVEIPIDCSMLGPGSAWLYGIDVFESSPFDPADPAMTLSCRACGVLINDQLAAWGQAPSAFLSGEPGEVLVATFELTNPNAAQTFDFMVVADPANPNAANVVSFEAQPPGMPITGSVFVGSGATVPIDVFVRLIDHDPSVVHEIMLLADTDGLTGFEPIAGVLLRSTAPPVHEGAQAGGVAESLLVSLESSGDLTLEWSDSCAAMGTDFIVYEGTLGGTFSTHVPVACTTGGDSVRTIAPAPGNTYYLTAPRTAIREGSAGTDSGGNSRSVSTQACLPREPPSCE